MFRRNLRLILTLAGVMGGLLLTAFNLEPIKDFWPAAGGALGVWGTVLTLAVGSILGGLIGFFLYPAATWMESRLTRTPVFDLLFGAGGLIVGLLIATLLSFTVTSIPWIGSILAVLAALVFGYLGMTLATRKRDEITSFLANWNTVGRRKGDGGSPKGPAPKILDTSVIIDGRIADIVQTGFLEGPLVIPGFVLEELRHIADSSDVLRRNRGRRGLDILNRIQKELAVPVEVYERDLGEGEVDSKLLRLARQLGGKIITNDYNLNKVAELQGVPVLNINELANAVKPAVLPGEELTVSVIKEGKEHGQGVAYLDDGTMIVIDGGRRHIGDKITVLVTSVLQTAAGRMIFARPREGHAHREGRGDRDRERVAP